MKFCFKRYYSNTTIHSSAQPPPDENMILKNSNEITIRIENYETIYLVTKNTQIVFPLEIF